VVGFAVHKAGCLNPHGLASIRSLDFWAKRQPRLDTDGREKRFEALVSEVFSHEGTQGTQRRMVVGVAVRKAGCVPRFAWIGVHSRFGFLG
jgi:hypothetical protein